jgi:hypothetical protein
MIDYINTDTGFDAYILAATDPEHRNFSPALAKRLRMERKVCKALVKAGLARGHSASVCDGEEWTVKLSKHQRTIMLALASTDGDTLRFRDSAGNKVADFFLVYGNDGYDVICDYSLTPEAEAIYAGLKPMLDRLESEG